MRDRTPPYMPPDISADEFVARAAMPPDVDPGPFPDEQEDGPAPWWAWPVAVVLVAAPILWGAWTLFP